MKTENILFIFFVELYLIGRTLFVYYLACPRFH